MLGIYIDQFLFRNLMVSFVVTYGPKKLQQLRLKSDVINWYDFGDKNRPFGGQK